MSFETIILGKAGERERGLDLFRSKTAFEIINVTDSQVYYAPWPTATAARAGSFDRKAATALLSLVKMKLPRIAWAVDLAFEHDDGWVVWPHVRGPAGCGVPIYHLDRNDDGRIQVMMRNFIVDEELVDDFTAVHGDGWAPDLVTAVSWIAADVKARLDAWGLIPKAAA